MSDEQKAKAFDQIKHYVKTKMRDDQNYDVNNNDFDAGIVHAYTCIEDIIDTSEDIIDTSEEIGHNTVDENENKLESFNKIESFWKNEDNQIHEGIGTLPDAMIAPAPSVNLFELGEFVDGLLEEMHTN